MNAGCLCPCFFCRPGKEKGGSFASQSWEPLCDPCRAELDAFRAWLRSRCSSLGRDKAAP
jgi:hypothetical protein